MAWMKGLLRNKVQEEEIFSTAPTLLDLKTLF